MKRTPDLVFDELVSHKKEIGPFKFSETASSGSCNLTPAEARVQKALFDQNKSRTFVRKRMNTFLTDATYKVGDVVIIRDKHMANDFQALVEAVQSNKFLVRPKNARLKNTISIDKNAGIGHDWDYMIVGLA